MNDFSKGSEWRRWDLHVHTATSYDSDYKGIDADELLCNALRKNQIKAVAITDHFKIDHERIIHLRSIAPDIVFFPGVELRTDKGANNLHIILIFSNDKDVKSLAEEFKIMMYDDKAKAKEDDKKVYWSFEDIVEFANKRDALISIHAGRKTNGIDKEITNAIPVNHAIKEEIAASVSFFEIGQLRDVTDYEKNVFKVIDRKPLIICSDCHDPRAYKPSQALWIKADLTFEGLKQCVYQPQDRVFIGDIPPVLDRYNKNKQVAIKELSVKQNANPKYGLKDWFDFDLKLNPGMVAVIGNKGTGKSAFSDILGHICKSRTMKYASFLNVERFWKAPNYSKDYDAVITWGDDVSKTCTLSDYNYETSIEDAQYLPQRYIEDICNNLSEEFQQEIDSVIFSYVNSIDSGKANSLAEYVSSKCVPFEAEISRLRTELHEINQVIVDFEKKQTTNYKKSIDADYIRKKEEIERHKKQIPTPVKKPSGENEQERRKIQEVDDHIEKLKKQRSILEQKTAELIEQNNEINRLLTRIKELEKDFNDINGELSTFSKKYHLDTDRYLIKLLLPIQALSELINENEVERKKIADELNAPENGINKKIESYIKQKQQLVANADAEEKKYQAYKTSLEEWEKKLKEIEGSTKDVGTYMYLKAEKEFVENGALQEKYKEALRRRKEIVEKLYIEKRQQIDIYKEIYQPVEKQVSELLADLENNISFMPDFEFRNISLFKREFLSLVNQKYIGIFRGNEESQKKFDQLYRDTDLKDCNSVWTFADSIAQATVEDLDKAEAKVPNMVEYYDKAYSLEYIGINYKLKLNGRDLEELSPGERGIVLLVFYLALSKDNKPIIIDQPEDNLDNQSVFSKLVPCIRKAKDRRQVIIVTHNPNIAVACDAEQIIYCKMDKQTYHIEYESGSIENPVINKHVVDVLEGTMPAFDLRKKKYINAAEE